MIIFKNPIRVRCLKCREEHFIEMEYIGTDKQQRSTSFEYEHIYRGELKCSHCGEKMKLLTTIFEYPEGFLNYHETDNKSCLVIDDVIDTMILFGGE
jgi:hypothetical protein